MLKNECPQIVVGTPGRILALARDKDLSLKNVRHFILDECDKMLESLGMPEILILMILVSVCGMLGFAFMFLLIIPACVGRMLFCRHEKRCARDFQDDSSWQASNDVFSNTQQGNPPSLQEIYARCNVLWPELLEFRSPFLLAPTFYDNSIIF